MTQHEKTMQASVNCMRFSAAINTKPIVSYNVKCIISGVMGATV